MPWKPIRFMVSFCIPAVLFLFSVLSTGCTTTKLEINKLNFPNAVNYGKSIRLDILIPQYSRIEELKEEMHISKWFGLSDDKKREYGYVIISMIIPKTIDPNITRLSISRISIFNDEIIGIEDRKKEILKDLYDSENYCLRVPIPRDKLPDAEKNGLFIWALYSHDKGGIELKKEEWDKYCREEYRRIEGAVVAASKIIKIKFQPDGMYAIYQNPID